MLAICICSAIVTGILSLLAMVANGVLLYVMYKDPLNCFRKPITVLIAALAINDFLTGSITGTFNIVSEIYCISDGIRNVPEAGSFATFIGLFALNNGTLLVMGLSGERLIAVAFPFYYRATASSRKTLTCVVCIVAYSFIFCLLQLSSIPMGIYYTLQLHLNLTFPLVSVLIFNFALLHLLRRYRRRACSMSSEASDSSFAAAMERRFDIDKQFAFTAILIVLFLVLSHAPFYLMTLIEVHCSHCVQGDWFMIFRRISLSFRFINSACDPFIYTFRIRQCRRSLIVLFLKRQKSVEVSPRSSQVENPSRHEVVLRRLSRMCPSTGEFVEEFREENLPDEVGLGIDNLAHEDLDDQLDLCHTKTMETKHKETAKDKGSPDVSGLGVHKDHQVVEDKFVYDTKL